MQQYSKSDVDKIVTKMKKYYNNMYKLTPIDLCDFLKIRSNFMQLGVLLSDNVLTMSDEKIAAYIVDKLKNTKCGEKLCYTEEGDKVEKVDLNIALAKDIDLIDEDRMEIRKHLLNENTTVVLERAGRAFSIVWNSKMTTCKVSVPSTWHINVPQSLLLDISEKDKKLFTEDDTTLSKTGNFIYDLLTRHSDYSIIKRMLEIELENTYDVIVKDVDKRKLNRLNNKGLSNTVSILLLALEEQIRNKMYSTHAILSILGYRKRLVKELNELIS